MCFDELREQLEAERIALPPDDVVGMVSAMWSVLDRKGELLTANDLLRGEKVRPMAQQLVARWSVISDNLVEAAQVLDDRGFEYRKHYLSLNVFTLLSTWRLLGRQWLADHPLSVTATDSFEKSLVALFAKNCDRWLVLSQWSGRWGKSTDKVFADYIADLASDWEKLRAAKVPEETLKILGERMDTWLGALQTPAEEYITGLRVLSRNDVHQYYLPLWLWHRLDADRWTASSVPLRESKRGSLNLDVDHVTAVKLWETIAPPPVEGSTDGDDDAEPVDAVDVAATVNALGNCFLLEKSFNIAKGAQPLRSFLERVHEFKQAPDTIDAWAGKVDIDEVLLDPRKRAAADVAKAIEDRTLRMKTALKEFAGATRDRADV